MILRNTIRNVDGHDGSRDTGEDQGRQLARLSARQLRRAPGAPGSGTRFLVAHAFWILAVTAAAVGAAGALAFSQKPLYKSQAVVAVEAPAVAASSGNPPNMATEEGVVTSGAVLATASRLLHVPIATLASGVSVHVPGTTTLLQIAYTDKVARIAQQRAQAIAQAYVSYRAPQPAAAQAKNPAKPAPLGTTPTAVLVTPAALPTSSASRDHLIDIGAALIVGLALGIGTAWLRDRTDDRLRGLFDLEAQAAAPVLGLIPAFRAGRRDPGGRLVMVAKPDSLVAEAYRGLRTRLVQAATPGNAKTVLVTSPGWEDKSTVAANLATALAQSGRDVVLVGADLRWGRAHELFGRGPGYGLSELLEGRTSLEEALQATEVPGLRLLPPGMTPADPAALLERPAWRLALSHIRMHTDVVVIEAPPILMSPDASPLADLTEMILIVTDARLTTRAQLRVAMREVEHVRGKLAGCVLDNVGRRRRLRSPRPGPAADGSGTADGRQLASSAAALASWEGAADQTATPTNGTHHAKHLSSPPSDDEVTQVIDPAEVAWAIRSDPPSASLLQDGELTSPPADGELTSPAPGDGQPASRLADTEPAPPDPAEGEDVQRPGSPPSPIEDLTIPQAPRSVPAENSSKSTSGPPQPAAPDLPHDARAAETAQPLTAAEPELPEPADPQPSDSRPDRLYPVKALLITIVAALIGSAMVILLRSGHLI